MEQSDAREASSTATPENLDLLALRFYLAFHRTSTIDAIMRFTGLLVLMAMIWLTRPLFTLPFYVFVVLFMTYATLEWFLWLNRRNRITRMRLVESDSPSRSLP